MMANDLTPLRKIMEIVKSTLLALAISLIFLWCAKLDRSAEELGPALSNTALLLLSALVAVHGTGFALITKGPLRSGGHGEGQEHPENAFLEMMKRMNLYLLIWFAILLGLWIYETLIIKAGIDIVGLFICLVVLHGISEAFFFIPFIGTIVISRIFPGRFRYIAGYVYIAMSVAALSGMIIWLIRYESFWILINFLEIVAVAGVLLSIFQLRKEARSDKVLCDGNK